MNPEQSGHTETQTVLVDSGERCRLRNRRQHDSAGDEDFFRNGVHLDYERILSANCWSRLSGVTQILSADHNVSASFSEPDSLISNRMTHSLRVAHVARSIAMHLIAHTPGWVQRHQLILQFGGLDADVATVAGLAHDLGHPPFGHAAEEALDEVARTEFALGDGFEGNAQTLRIVAKLEMVGGQCGMDLTRASLAALIKYPWVREPNGKKARKFSVYNTESEVMAHSRRYLPTNFPHEVQALEASIMDVADDISYALQDLEDFFAAGLLERGRVVDDLLQADPESAFVSELKEKLEANYGDYPFAGGHFDQAVDEARDIVGKIAKTRQTPKSAGLAKGACSRQIADFVKHVDFNKNEPGEPLYRDGPLIGLHVSRWDVLQILKEIAVKEIIESQLVSGSGKQGADCVAFLARRLSSLVEQEDPAVPPRLKRMLEDPCHGGPQDGCALRNSNPAEARRRILDYICTLTDRQARELSERLGYGLDHPTKPPACQLACSVEAALAR